MSEGDSSSCPGHIGRAQTMQPTVITRNSMSPVLQNFSLPGSDTPNRILNSVPKARLSASDSCLTELEREKSNKLRKRKGIKS